MTFKYKLNVLISFVITVTGLFVFQSCHKDNDDFDYHLEIPEKYNQVGKLHNEGLEFVFQAIKKAHLENLKSADSKLKSVKVLDYETIVQNSTLQFCKEHKSLRENFDISQSVIAKAHSNLKSLKMGDALDKFNPKQRELLNETFAAVKVEYSKLNLEKLKEDLAKINEKALTELSAIEAAPIYCATSTAYATFQYWNKNYKKWYFAIHFPEILKDYNDAQLNKLSLKNGNLRLKSGWWDSIWDTAEDFWNAGSDAVKDWWDNGGRDVVAADASGAGQGALEGAVIAVSTAGTAWGAIPTGAVAGAVLNSSGEIITIWVKQ